MTDHLDGNNNGDNGNEGSGRARTPRGKHLPRSGLDDVAPLVQAMVDLEAGSSRKLIFDQAGFAASGGASKTKWAALGYYGLRDEVAPGKYAASDRGQALVGGDTEAERRAKQHAIVETGFRGLVARFSGSPVRLQALAGLLQEEFRVPEGQAKTQADLLVALATEAGLIQDGSFRVAPIEQALEAVPESGNGKPKAESRISEPSRPKRPEGEKQRPQSTPSAPPAPEQPQTGGGGEAPAARTGTAGEAGPFGVSVELKIDAKDHSPEEIGEILRRARKALTGAPS